MQAGSLLPAILPNGTILVGPSADGMNGQALATNGSGQLAFITVAASSAWGSITGTLSAQTDLNTALGLKANISSLGSAAFVSTSAFDASGAAAAAQANAIAASDTAGAAATAQTNAVNLSCQRASNLSDVSNAGTARTNLGLGSASTQASSAFDASGAATTAQTNAIADGKFAKACSCLLFR